MAAVEEGAHAQRKPRVDERAEALWDSQSAAEPKKANTESNPVDLGRKPRPCLGVPDKATSSKNRLTPSQTQQQASEKQRQAEIAN